MAYNKSVRRARINSIINHLSIRSKGKDSTMKHWPLFVMLVFLLVIGALVAVNFAPAAGLQPASQAAQPAAPAAAAATATPVAPPVIGMPNPASVFCEKNGGKLDIRKDAKGGEFGVCIFPDKSECEEWAFFRGECKPGGKASADMPNPASAYCADQGGKLEIRKNAAGGEAGVCVFPDGSECDEWAFFRNECQPGGQEIADMPNPASVYCADQGGKIAIRKDATGGEYGMCVFADGSECDEWAFFNSECQPGGKKPAPVLPRHITFAEGSYSATVQDDVPVGALDRYTLTGQAGQTLSLNFTAQNDALDVTVYGADGKNLLTHRIGTLALSVRLPASQDYFIDLESVITTPVGYIMQVSLPPAPVVTPTPPQAIHFAVGAASATVRGKASAATSAEYYLTIYARQTLTAKITAADAPAYLIIWGADGTVLISDHAGASSWSGAVPKTQPYHIAVRSSSQTPSNFTLQVTIPPLATPVPKPTAKRITFPAGGTTATVRGNLAARGMDVYTLAAGAGQIMTVNVSAPGNAAILVIYSKEGTVLISDHAGATHWEGRLPLKGEYIIDVKSHSGAAVAYTLQVTIPPLMPGQ
jgi:putative hemolysin